MSWLGCIRGCYFTSIACELTLDDFIDKIDMRWTTAKHNKARLSLSLVCTVSSPIVCITVTNALLSARRADVEPDVTWVEQQLGSQYVSFMTYWTAHYWFHNGSESHRSMSNSPTIPSLIFYHNSNVGFSPLHSNWVIVTKSYPCYDTCAVVIL